LCAHYTPRGGCWVLIYSDCPFMQVEHVLQRYDDRIACMHMFFKVSHMKSKQKVSLIRQALHIKLTEPVSICTIGNLHKLEIIPIKGVSCICRHPCSSIPFTLHCFHAMTSAFDGLCMQQALRSSTTRCITTQTDIESIIKNSIMVSTKMNIICIHIWITINLYYNFFSIIPLFSLG
jgi:hypothetical protein